MKSFKLFLTVLFLAVLGLSNAWAVDPDYTLTPAAGSNNSYTGNCDVEIDGITWNVNGNAQQVPWRIGGKSISNTDRAVYSKTAYASAVSKIDLTVGGASSITVNSLKLVYSTNADFSSSTEISGAFAANSTISFAPTSGEFPKDAYYKFIFNVTVSGTSNKFVEFSKVEIYNASTGDPDPEPSCSTPTITFAGGAEVAKLTTDAAFTNAASVEFESTATGQTITYSVEDGKAGVATVNATTGEVTIVGAGEAKIYASVEANATYCEKNAYYTLTVTAPVVPTGTFTKYVGATLVEGDYLVCVGTDAMKNSVTSNRLDYASVTVTDNAVENPDATVIWHIAPAATAGYVTMYNAAVEKYAASTGTKNQAGLLEDGTADKSLWSVSMPTIESYNFENKNNKANSVNACLQKNGTYGFACYAAYSNITLYAKLGSYAISKASCTNGTVDVTGVADLSQVNAGTTVTLTNTPADGYKLAEYDVYKTDDATSKVTVTDGKFTMPAYDVTISATFEVAKVLDGSVLTLGGTYPTEFWKGDAFSHEGLTASALFNTGSADVTDDVTFSGYDMTTAGSQTVTVTYTEGGASQTASYDITVQTIANTQATAYTVAEAIALIDAGKDLSTQVYVAGKVSQIVTPWSDQYNNITYSISDDGRTTSDQFQLFRCVTNDIAVGGDVVALGTLIKYNSTYEFTAGNSVVSYTPPTVVRKEGEITGTNKTSMATDEADDVYEITYNGDGILSVVSSNTAVATIALDGTTVTVHPVSAGTTTITILAPQTETYTEVSKSYTLTVKAGLSAAALPFSFNGGKGDMNVANGIKHEGLGTDYSSAPKLKFDTQGDYVVIRVAEAIKKVTYTVKGNSYTAGQFDVLQSADNQTYTTLMSLTDFEDGAKTTAKPAADTRYIKFVYTSKNAGNVALGNIEIVAASAVEPAGLAFEQASYRFVTTATKTVAAASAKGSTGAITYSCEDANLTINASTGVITCTTAGTYTVKAAIAATAEYEAGEATCTVKVVEPAIANSIIVAETTEGKVFAMTNTLSETYVTHVEIQKIGDKYLVDEATYDAILYQTNTDAEGQTTIVSMSNMYLQATAAKKVSFTESEYFWTLADGKLTAADADYGTLQYNVSSPRFTTYTSKVGQYATIVSLDNVVKNVMSQLRTGLTEGDFGTMCQANDILYAEGAVFFEIEKPNAIGLDLVEAKFPLVAGKPYFYQATAAEVNVVFGNEVATEVVEANGLVGRLSTATGIEYVPTDMYVIQKNALRKVATGDIKFLADHAYINYGDVTDQAVEDDPQATPRRRVTMGGLSADVVTSMDEIATEQGAVKFIENGVLYILRDGKRYNAQGQLVK